MKSVVLLSAGIDSLANLYQAQKVSEVILALTFDYGQRASQKEIKNSIAVCKKLKIAHQVIPLGFMKSMGKSSLTHPENPLPLLGQVNIQSLSVSQKTARSVWVPNRNGIFINVAAGMAESLEADQIVVGFNQEEASTFSDNSKEFVQASMASLKYSTMNAVQVVSYTIDMDKTQIVQSGKKWGVDWSYAWPCYQNLEKWCGECESCQRARRAFLACQVDVSGLFLRQ